MRSILGGIGLTILLSLATAGAAVAAPPSTVSDSFAITNVQVFDGSQVVQAATVVVLNGQISAVGANAAIPAGVPVIDGTGATLLPGFIDSHAHARTRQELERAIQFGVTTEMDMWTLPHFAASMRREQERTGAPYRADFFSAISPATLPEGYPYNFTPRQTERPTLVGPEEAEAFVEDRIAEGSDYLKIMIEDGSQVFLDLQVIPRETVQALTQAMHDRGKLAVAHVIEQGRAYDALHDGVDGLVHIFVDEVAEPGFVQLAVMKGIFVVPTLSVEEAFVTTAGGASLIADPDLAPYLTQEEIASLLTPGPPSLLTLQNVEFAKESVRRLHEAGVPILAGTDSATHGVSLHRDLELLVDAGLEPVDALVAATSAAADAFGLADRGRIAPGLRADLLLVQGDPTADIKATRKLRRIWKAGVEVDRQIPAARPAH
ncbi:MAG TPA: amidohydrolase family protein [Thermoanaerobaculia bacterium]|nr:amidohydrolase family protein [Thermoanaerobaculia bacterium]